MQRDRRARPPGRGAASPRRPRGGSRRLPVSTTTWSARRTATVPRTSAITRASGGRGSRRRRRRARARAPGATRLCGDGGGVRRAVEVADRDRERVGGVLGVRRHLERQQRLDHARDLVLVGAARAADGVLDLLRRVGDDVEAALAGGEHDDAARLADGERARGVLAEVDVLHRDRPSRGARRAARRRAGGSRRGGSASGLPGGS